MNALARRENGNHDASDEVQKLQAVIDQSYARMRERASMEWRRRCAGTDASDACVHVHIEQSNPQALEV